MDKVTNNVVTILLGALFAYVSLTVAGIGAAIAIPSSILTPFSQVSPYVAFAVVNLVTIGLPLLATYLVFAAVARLLTKQVSYLLLTAPFILLYLFSYFEIPPHNGMLFNVITSLPSMLAVVFCAIVMARKSANTIKA